MTSTNDPDHPNGPDGLDRPDGPDRLDHTHNGRSTYEPRRFDPTAFDPGPDLPPLPTLRPLPTIRPLNAWPDEPAVSAKVAEPAVSAEPAKVAEPAVSAGPAVSAKVAEPPVSAGPAKVAEPAVSAGPAVSAQVAEPAVTAAPATPPVRHRRRAPEPVEEHASAPQAPAAPTHTTHALRPSQPDPAPAVLPSTAPPSSTAPRLSAAAHLSTAPHPSAEPSLSAHVLPTAPTPEGDVHPRPTSTRRVLVLGGSGTIGSAIVRELAARGVRVAVHHASRATETDDLVASLPGDGHVSVSADLADADAVGELVRCVDANFGGLDVVINAASAGDAVRHASVVGSSLSDWTDAWTGTLTVDVLGAATTAHAAAAAFIARGQGGRIILLAARGRPFSGGRGSVTVATEQAVAALGSALAVELAPYGVSVVVVGSGSAAASGWSPEALAETVSWLATGPSSALAGATFNIAG